MVREEIKDSFGNVLNIGDTIVTMTTGRYPNFMKAIIKGFSDAGKVKIEYLGYSYNRLTCTGEINAIKSTIRDSNRVCKL